MAKKFSQFPSAASISPGDSVVGLKDGTNTRFSFATFLSSIQSLFVPTSRKVNNKALSSDITLDADDVGAYELPSGGMPKTDLAQGVQDSLDAADSAYQLPSGGIPETDLDSAVQTSLGLADTAYQLPAGGMPSSDMASAVQTSLGKADTAYQKPSGGIPASDLASGVIPTVPSAYTSNPEMDGTASPGSSGAWAKGDHVHPSDTSRVPVYGLGKNLLDNWYFLNPVNQRGQSTYTGVVYGPDRWKGANNQSVMTLVSNGLQLSTTDSSFRIWQQLCSDKTKSLLSGKTGTISVIEDGVLYSATGVFGTRFDATGAKYAYAVNTSQNEIVRIGGGTSGAAVISAIKVELGTEQTLCHNEGTAENPVWVLNEIPDYEYELYRCITSTADPSDTYANKSLITEPNPSYGPYTASGGTMDVEYYYKIVGELVYITGAATPTATVGVTGRSDVTFSDLPKDIAAIPVFMSANNCTVSSSDLRPVLQMAYLGGKGFRFQGQATLNRAFQFSIIYS